MTKLKVLVAVMGQYHQRRKRSKKMNILTTKDIQNMLKISHKKAKALMRTEGFPAVKIGRDYRVTEEAFSEWMSNPKAVKLDYSKC